MHAATHVSCKRRWLFYSTYNYRKQTQDRLHGRGKFEGVPLSEEDFIRFISERYPYWVCKPAFVLLKKYIVQWSKSSNPPEFFYDPVWQAMMRKLFKDYGELVFPSEGEDKNNKEGKDTPGQDNDPPNLV